MSKKKAKTSAKKLTLEQRTKLLLTSCKTKAELKNWIKYHLSLDLPDCTVSRYADTNPLDAIWQIYDICVNNNNPQEVQELLYVASRGAGKTLAVAVAEFMVMLHDQRDVVHVGAILSQAKRCYDYITGFMLNDRVKPVLASKNKVGDTYLEKANMEKSIFNLMDRYSGESTKVTMEVLPCTLKACSDPSSIVLVKNRGYCRLDEVNVGDEIASFDKTSLKTRYAKVLEHKTVFEEAVKLAFSNGSSFVGSLQHKILTKRGAITLADINKTVEIIEANDGPFSESIANYRNKEVGSSQYFTEAVIGMMLGDASMSIAKSGNPRLYKGHSHKQYDYLLHCAEVIKGYCEVKDIRKKISGFGSTIYELRTETTERLKWISDLFLVEGRKQITKKVCNLITPVSLAYWFMDDGSADDTVTFATCGFTDAECQLLVNRLHEMGYKSAKTINTKYNLIRLNNSDSKKFCLDISKYCIPSMQYKLSNTSVQNAYRLSDGQKVKYSKNGIPKEKDSRSHRQWRQSFQDLPSISIIEKTYLGKQRLIRLEVEGQSFLDHTYITNNIISFNCNGPHVALVSVDEIDTVTGEGLKAFKDISGMLDSKKGRHALRVGISTRKSRYGLMNQQIEDAEKAGRDVRKWTTLEFNTRCPDSRSGTDPVVGYVLQDTMEVLDEEHWLKKDKQKQSEYFRNEFPGSGCLRCPMGALCLGDSKKQTSTSNMLKPISDAIKKTMENGPDWAISQLYNLKPSVEGIIYKEFEEKLHVKNWNQMWEILTGREYPGECTHDLFVKKCHAMGLSCYAGIDWGWSNPSTVVFFFVDNRENVYVVRCEGQTFTNNPTWVQMIKNKWHQMYRCQLYFPDMANPGDAVTMRQEGLPCPNEQTKDTPGGIQVVKKWLRSLASPVPKIFFAGETCKPIIQEFQLYHFKTDAAGLITEDPEKEFDHWLDALRYAMYDLFGKNRMVMSNYGVEDVSTPVVDRYGNFTRNPTPQEFASVRGVKINNPVDMEKVELGKIGTKSELEKDDVIDEGIGGSGSFLFSF